MIATCRSPAVLPQQADLSSERSLNREHHDKNNAIVAVFTGHNAVEAANGAARACRIIKSEATEFPHSMKFIGATLTNFGWLFLRRTQ